MSPAGSISPVGTNPPIRSSRRQDMSPQNLTTPSTTKMSPPTTLGNPRSMNSSAMSTPLRDRIRAASSAADRSVSWRTTLTPLDPEESVGLTTMGQRNPSTSVNTCSDVASALKLAARGQGSPAARKCLRKRCFSDRISTDFNGLPGSPIFSATYAAVGAAGSDAYARTPLTRSFRATSRTASLSVVLV